MSQSTLKYVYSLRMHVKGDMLKALISLTEGMTVLMHLMMYARSAFLPKVEGLPKLLLVKAGKFFLNDLYCKLFHFSKK